VLSILGGKVALVIPTRLSYLAVEELRAREYDIVEITDSGELDKMCINVLSMGQNEVFVPADCPKLIMLLTEKGYQVQEVDISAIRAGGGGLHCMTGVLQRDIV
jgi:N-dimethylarginine dimethylaminohydrolase